MPAGTIPVPGQRTAYGSVPGPIAVPPNTFTQLGAVPGFNANTAGTGSVINSELSGRVSPMTLNALKSGAAQFGISSGLGPGSGLETNELFGNIAGFSEGQQEKGVRNYLGEVSALGPTMTNPNLAAEISARNADLASAPDPKLAAEQAFQDWLRGFNYTRSAGTPAGPWQGATTFGAPSGATIGRSYAPAGGGVFSSPDAFGYTYSSPEAGTTPVLGATNPTEPYTPASSNPYFYTGEGEYPAGVDPTNPYGVAG